MAPNPLGKRKSNDPQTVPDPCPSSSSHGADPIFVDRLVVIATEVSHSLNRPTKDCDQVVAEPHPHDVLCGRGGLTNHHEGNINFRQLVNLNKNLYAACPNGRHKMIVSASVMESVRRQNPPGRFLERDAKTGMWRDIGRKRSLYKTSQALREFRGGVSPDAEKETKRQRRKTLRSATARMEKKNKIHTMEGPEKNRHRQEETGETLSLLRLTDLGSGPPSASPLPPFKQEGKNQEKQEISEKMISEAVAAFTPTPPKATPVAKDSVVSTKVGATFDAISGAVQSDKVAVYATDDVSPPTMPPFQPLNFPPSSPPAVNSMAEQDDDDALLMQLMAQDELDPFPLFPLDFLPKRNSRGVKWCNSNMSADCLDSEFAGQSCEEDFSFQDDQQKEGETDRATPEVVATAQNPQASEMATQLTGIPLI